KRDENKVIGSSNGNVNFENDGPIMVEDGVIVMGQNVNNIDSLYNGGDKGKITGCLSDMYKVSHKEDDDNG
ncbi:hypothetical protein Tco_0346248, partial [Tanacetum coccineum]